MPLFRKSELDTVGLLRRPTVKAAVPAAVISRANTMRTLGALADFGVLKSESIAALCFPAPRYSQGLLMAQRKLKNLAASKLVIPRLDAHGTRSWVLSTAGAALVDAHDGCELSPGGSTYSHHFLGARYLIFKQVCQGYTCYSEHAFTHNRAPFRASDLLATLGKVPDGILLLPGGNPRATGASATQQKPQLFALETEIAIKAEHQISKQLSMLACTISRNGPTRFPLIGPTRAGYRRSRRRRVLRDLFPRCKFPGKDGAVALPGHLEGEG